MTQGQVSGSNPEGGGNAQFWMNPPVTRNNTQSRDLRDSGSLGAKGRGGGGKGRGLRLGGDSSDDRGNLPTQAAA